MAKLNRKTDAGADYTDVVFSGGTYVGKMKRGNGPQIRCHEPHPVRIPRIQTTKSVVGKHSGSASLAMVRNTDCHKTAVKAPHTPSRPKASSYSDRKIYNGPGGPIGNVYPV